jgi:hypothetical protein
MDTNDLTQMAYDSIWYANDAVDFLKTELGATCSEYKTEDDYLKAILERVEEIEEDPEDYLDSWNILEQIDIRDFKRKIRKLRKHIEKTIKTPIEKRGATKW